MIAAWRIGWICALLPFTCAAADVTDLEASYGFLVGSRAHGAGVLAGPDGVAGRDTARVPVSFIDSEQYWGAYVCALPGASCAVSDYYDPADYTIKPPRGPAGELQTERIDVHNGTNIYDAATWQIAVMVGAVVNHYPNLIRQDAYDLVAAWNEGLAAKRATTRGSLFVYNGSSISDSRAAYSFRMISSEWLAEDPLAASRYGSVVVATGLPAARPEYRRGVLSWNDWKPITGENAWAFLLGPLQAAYLHYVLDRKARFVPFREVAVQNALDILPTFAAMQSSLGGVYYAPWGTLRNDANQAVNTHVVSVENNFSLYAGLQVLRQTLLAELARERSLGDDDRQRIRASLHLIEVVIQGGELPTGRATRGLLSFFREAAWHEGEFVQGGLAEDPARGERWVPVLKPKAVDVNTWGVAALGAGTIDGWFGFGAAYRVWQSVKSWGAYGVGASVRGVGYSDLDGNGQDDHGAYRQGILSAEWTAGALMMVRSMRSHYAAVPRGSRNYDTARQYVASLGRDEHSMLEGVQTLRLDRYVMTEFPGKPPGYEELIVQPGKPYLYASRRYRIPFGWYANPLPSTCATAWIVMVADDYDPFGYGGKHN